MIHEQKAQASAQKSKAAEKSKERHSHRTDGSRCPICGAEISSRFEICPECGGKLVSYCTFCGADMDRNDTECPECGMPAGGVKCPECGTLNHRSFCSKCNTPLTRAAQKAVQKALEDPKVKEAIDLCAKLAELEAQMEEAEDAGDFTDGEDAPEAEEVLSEGAKRMMEILGTVKPGMPEHAKPGTVPAKPKPAAKPKSIDRIKEEYKKTVRDINKIFDEMLPPAGTTPQEQRNFYSARKVAVETTVKRKIKVPVEWICNYCGCHHKQPSECAEPELGGTWVYIEKTETTRVKEYKYQ